MSPFSETLEQIWSARYGESQPCGPEFAPFLAHRSVRQFDARPIDEESIRGLVACAQSASTSSNLQLWSMISVQDPERREAIAQLCADQKQVRTASWFFAFLADHYRIRHAAEKIGATCEGLTYTEFFAMACIDAALAAERMVVAAEAIGLGICYIGALRNEPAKVAELLELPHGTFGVFGLCLGYPAADAHPEIKPRLSQDAIWFRETYNREPDVAEFDARMVEFYRSQNMSGDHNWTARSSRRLDGNHMTGRDTLLDWLQSQGLALR